MSKAPALKDAAKKIFLQLKKIYPDAHCELNYSNPLELLIATILSAQCTDKRVNEVTPILFKACKKLKDYLNIPVAELEKIVRSTGFFRSKAKSIKGATERIDTEFGGEVPKSMEELITLPGVGRKTANVVLSNAFDLPGLPVDTHVKRVSHRLGLTDSEDPVKIEHELGLLLSPKDWGMLSHLLIFHGRRTCVARKPKCESCTVANFCRYFQEHQA